MMGNGFRHQRKNCLENPWASSFTWPGLSLGSRPKMNRMVLSGLRSPWLTREVYLALKGCWSCPSRIQKSFAAK